MTKPFLYNTVDMLYNSVMKNMPESIQEKDSASAFILGFGGTYLLTKLLQWASRNIADPILPGFDQILLPALERTCQMGVIALPVFYALVDPEGAKAIITQHPVYTSGMIGVGAAGLISVEQDINKKSRNQLPLEKEVEKPVVYPPEEKDL